MKTTTTLFQDSEPVALANDSSKWYRLAAKGNYSHALGMQVVDDTAIRALANSYNNIWGKIKNIFSKPPIYIGHPDVPSFTGSSGHDNFQPLGNIEAVEARPDGLYIRATWNEAAQPILESGNYKMSPYWASYAIDSTNLRPHKLISIGLTTTPNFPNAATANSANNQPTTDETDEIMNENILKKLGLPTDATEKQILDTLDSLTTATANATATANQLASITAEKQASDARAIALANSLIDTACKLGICTAATAETETAKLLSASDVTATANALFASEKAVKTISLANSLREKTPAQARSEFEGIIKANEQKGLPYDAAWQSAKSLNPELYRLAYKQ